MGDDVAVLVNGAVVGTFHAEDTGNDGAGWNVFVNSSAISLGNLPVGNAAVSLRVGASDGFGVDFDRLALVPGAQFHPLGKEKEQ